MKENILTICMFTWSAFRSQDPSNSDKYHFLCLQGQWLLEHSIQEHSSRDLPFPLLCIRKADFEHHPCLLASTYKMHLQVGHVPRFYFHYSLFIKFGTLSFLELNDLKVSLVIYRHKSTFHFAVFSTIAALYSGKTRASWDLILYFSIPRWVL